MSVANASQSKPIATQTITKKRTRFILTAISVIPGVVFSGSIDGHLRAYSTTDGKIIWQFNTIQPYETVNGVKSQGGSIDAAGPVIAGGMVLTNSGYGLWRGRAGNVLLAFGLP